MPQSAIASGAVDLRCSRLRSLRASPDWRSILTSGATSRRNSALDDRSEFRRVIARCARTRASISANTATPRSSAAPRAACSCAGSRRPASTQASESDRDEAEALYRDVLINVTSFFRDPEMFDDLKRDVFPEIVKTTPVGQPIRIWVPGCSTGQEAYSIAMSLVEFLEAAQAKRPIQIFATDLGDPESLDKARAGLYPESIEAEVSPERLRRFFVKEDRTTGFEGPARALRICPPEPHGRSAILARGFRQLPQRADLHVAGAAGAAAARVSLRLESRTASWCWGWRKRSARLSDLFQLVNSTHKIYRRKDSARAPPLSFMADEWLAGITSRVRIRHDTLLPADFQRESERLILGRYAPPSVLVDQNFDVQQFRGRTSPFLEPPCRATNDQPAAHGEGRPVCSELRSALAEAKATRTHRLTREGLRVAHAGSDDRVHVARAARSRSRIPTHVACWCCSRPRIRHGRYGGCPCDWTGGIGADRDVAWLRQELASTKRIPAVDRGRPGGGGPGAARGARRSAVEQRRAAEHERRAGDDQGRAAVGERGADHRQRAVPVPQPRARRAAQTTCRISSAAPISRWSRSAAICDPAADARGATSRSTCCRRDVGRSMEHIKFALRRSISIGDAIESVISPSQPWEQRSARQRRPLVAAARAAVPDQRRPHRWRHSSSRSKSTWSSRSHELMEARDYALAVVRTVREPLVVLDGNCVSDSRTRRSTGCLAARAPTWKAGCCGRRRRGVWPMPTCDARCWRPVPATTRRRRRDRSHAAGARAAHAASSTPQPFVREGRPTLLLLAIDDVTDDRAGRSAAHRGGDAAAASIERKDEFLGVLAHELRNPLAPMRFALEMLRRSDDEADAESLKARQVLDRQVDHMVRIVDDLLDVSRITQGKVELRKEHIELRSIVNAAVELCRPLDRCRQSHADGFVAGRAGQARSPIPCA